MKIRKSVISVIICILIAVSTPFAGFSASALSLDDVKNAVEGVISYKSSTYGATSALELLNSLSSQAGNYSSDWYYIALSQYGVDCRNQSSISALKNAVNGFYSGELSSVKVTDMQRVAFALLACGESVTSVNGHSLLADCTYNRAKYRALDSQGVNSVAYALLLLDSDDFNVPDDAETKRDDMIKLILDKELDSGGFALFGSSADIDVTTIVMQALAPYKNKDGVKAVLDKCTSILSNRQTSDGSYKSFSNNVCAESTAQVILALTANGISPMTDGRFTKNGNSVLDGLLSFKLENGAFTHFLNGEPNNMATYQSLCALVSCYRYMNGSKSFYDFRSNSSQNTDEVNKAINEKQAQKKADLSSKSKIKSSSAQKKAKKTTKSTSSKVKLKSTSDNSKITFTKVTRVKKKTKTAKEKTTATIPSEQETVTSTADEAKKAVRAKEKQRERTTQAIPFAVIFAGYPALVLYKLRRKK